MRKGMEDAMNRRELRRQRRRRNQIIAYLVAGLILAAILFGCVFVIRSISGAAQGGNGGVQEEDGGTAGVEEPTGETASEQTETSGQSETPEPTDISAQQENSAEEGSIQQETSGEETLEAQIRGYVEAMTLEEKVAGLFIITPEQLTGVGTAVQAGESTREALEQYPVGGLVYFAKNIQSEQQLKEMLANTASYSRHPLFLGVDEEGGQVARVAKALNLDNVGPMAEIGASGDVNAAYAAGAAIASYLKEYGFNLDFAPVADVLTNPDNTVIGDRSFGSDPALVSQMVAAAVRGFQENGVNACIKHFPGHGGTAGDSHNGYAYVDDTLEELKSGAFVPFQEGIDEGIPVIMAGHISCPQVTGDDTPATMSYTLITETLRGDMGFDGIVVTDALNMGAVTEQYTSGEAALTALNAGVDLLLMPEDFQDAYQAVLQAAENGELPKARIDESVERILKVKIQMIGEDVVE